MNFVADSFIPDGSKAYVRVFELNLDSNTLYQNIDFKADYTSFIFEVTNKTEFVNAYYQSEQNDVYFLDTIPTTDQPEDIRRSPFIIPNTTQHRFNFYSGKIVGKVRLYLFYAPPIQLEINKKLFKKTDACQQPEMVKGSIWREGLPEPVGVREQNEVGHCIIHHAASSNSNHDYVNVVRNIYLLHTQTNGWDDIGYNFLVAQDGTIFEGRYHQNIDSTDNVKGAHFCGKNSGTMGICMLGNYEETAPTDSAITALTNLLTWKCFKDDINALDSSRHPTSTSSFLPHIAGHRQGCATACPGDSMFRLLPQIKQEVEIRVKACHLASMVNQTALPSTLKWSYNQTTELLRIPVPEHDPLSNIKLINTIGEEVYQTAITPGQKEWLIQTPTKGIYVILGYTDGNVRIRQKIRID